MKRHKEKERPSFVRVGAMQRPRDVAPDRVPVQFVDGPDDPAPQECDLDARIIAQVEAIARREGRSLDRMLERIICPRLGEQGEEWKGGQ